MQRRKSAIRSPVSLDANGPNRTLVAFAANGGLEPILLKNSNTGPSGQF
jgi:hypothetical protein